MPFQSIFYKDYTAFAYAKTAQYQKTIDTHEEKGMRLVRIVSAKEFKGNHDKYIEEQIPEGYNVLLFSPATAIPLEEMSMEGIIDNEGRPYVIFDVESTGLEHTDEEGRPGKDRVIQLGIVKFSPLGTLEGQYVYLFNPGFPIPEEATAVHGIRDEDVADAPVFSEKASEIADLMAGCDIVAYNIEFDTQFMRQEFNRVAIKAPFDEPGTAYYDPLKIFKRQIPHTLTAAFSLYDCDGVFAPHGAVDDCLATAAVMRKQLLHANLGGDLGGLWKEFQHPYLDMDQRLKLDDEGKIVIDFGKYKGTRLFEIMQGDMNYVEWMIKKFNPDCVAILKHNVEKFNKWKKKKSGK